MNPSDNDTFHTKLGGNQYLNGVTSQKSNTKIGIAFLSKIGI